MNHSAVRLACALAAAALSSPLAALANPQIAATQQAGPQGAASRVVTGEVLEVRDVEIYTYLRLKTAEGEVWAAVSKAPVKKGAKVAIANAAVMQNFQSKTLNKTFDRIIFGTLAAPGAAAAAAAPAKPMTGMGMGMGGMPAAAPAAPATAKAEPAMAPVPKAQGADAKTVAEIVNGRTALKDKPVTVRGRVVKVNNGIMGKNWLHLRDGTGAAADGSNDILVTTKDSAAVGDVVSAKGTVRTNVQLGGGYDYAVLVDGASVKK